MDGAGWGWAAYRFSVPKRIEAISYHCPSIDSFSQLIFGGVFFMCKLFINNVKVQWLKNKLPKKYFAQKINKG